MGMFVLILVIAVAVVLVPSIKLVRQGEVLVVERLGKYHHTAGEGLNLVIPLLDVVRNRVDMREQVRDFDPVATITKDNVGVLIDSVMYFTVVDAQAYTYGAAVPVAAIATLTATTLRNEIGGMELDETLTGRDSINTKLKLVLDQAGDPYGLRIGRVEIKNITPPRDVLETMEKQLRAERERREAILRAEGEKRSAILRAEGEAEARRIQAETEARAVLIVAEAQARAEQVMNEALAASRPTREVVALRALAGLKEIANGQATKIILPSELTGVGALSALVRETSGL